MKRVFFIVSLFFAVTAIGQDLPDSGFTNKAEAKNLMVNGVKEGRWFERLNGLLETITDTSLFKIIKDTNGNPSYKGEHFYVLSVYKGGKLFGITRWYQLDWTLWCEYPYIDDKLNGVYKEYYHDGKIEQETPYANGKIIGTAKRYYKDGKIKTKVIYKNGKEKSAKYYDETGREISLKKLIQIDRMDSAIK